MSIDLCIFHGDNSDMRLSAILKLESPAAKRRRKLWRQLQPSESEPTVAGFPVPPPSY